MARVTCRPSLSQLDNLQEPRQDEEGVVTALAESATNHQKLLAQFDGQHWTAEAVPVERLRHAWCGPDQYLLGGARLTPCSSGKRAGREAMESEESSARQYYDVAVEPGGAFWLATSDGLFRYAPLTWRRPASGPASSTPWSIA